MCICIDICIYACINVHVYMHIYKCLPLHLYIRRPVPLGGWAIVGWLSFASCFWPRSLARLPCLSRLGSLPVSSLLTIAPWPAWALHGWKNIQPGFFQSKFVS